MAERLHQLNKAVDQHYSLSRSGAAPPRPNRPGGSPRPPATATDPLMLVLAADHIINNQPVFHDAIRVAEQYADEGHLVTFGIVPNAPETGYGYIQRGVALTDSAHTRTRWPASWRSRTAERAGVYLASGSTTGTAACLCSVPKYLSELAKYRPDILEACGLR